MGALQLSDKEPLPWLLLQRLGRLGVKVWIYKGEIIGSRADRAATALAEARAPKPERRGPRTPRAPRAEVTTSQAAPVAADTTPAAPATEGGAE